MKTLLHSCCFALFLTFASGAGAVVIHVAGDVDLSFDPGSSINRAVRTVVVLPNDQVLIGGDFTTVHGAVRGYIARLNADGSTDTSFMDGLAGPDNYVSAIAVQEDGKILIAGGFTTVHGAARDRVARLNADGSLDRSFLEDMPGLSQLPENIAVQSDGKVLVGGSGFERLNADGSPDTSFRDELERIQGINSIVVQPGDNGDTILIGGSFTAVDGVERPGLARLNGDDGSLDTDFVPEILPGGVRQISVLDDGQILLGGSFGSFTDPLHTMMERLNGTDGSRNGSFANSGLAGFVSVNAFAVQSDGKIVVVARNFSVTEVLRLNDNGSLDASFGTSFSGTDPVPAVALQSDGTILIGGNFRSVGGVSRHHVAALSAENGALLDSFQNGPPGANQPFFGNDAAVYSLAVQAADGKIVVGGGFTHIGGQSRNRIARLNTDGSLDASFLDGLDGLGAAAGPTVRAVAMQTDGKILIGGNFSAVNEVARKGIARLNDDGSLDVDFQNDMDGVGSSQVRAIAVQSDGKILIGGNFSTVNGETRNRIARLNSDGSLDVSFQNGMTGAQNTVHSIVLQSGGKILIGGDFTEVNGEARSRIARLNEDGSLDGTFVPGTHSPIRSMALQSDGKIVFGGSSSLITRLNSDGSSDESFQRDGGGVAYTVVSSVAVQSDGKILLAGSSSSPFGQPRHLTRLHPDGSLDSDFMDGLSGADQPANSVALQSDGQILVGGIFDAINGVARGGIARLHAEDVTLDPPVIAAHPEDQEVVEGQAAVFAVTAAGSDLTYQWQFNGGDIPAATGASHTIPEAMPRQAGDYRVVVSNLAGNVTSNPATLTVITPPQITAPPVSQTASVGGEVTFAVSAAGIGLNYQWKLNGGDIPGATGASYTIGETMANQAGAYTVMVGNLAGAVSSSAAILSFVDLDIYPGLTIIGAVETTYRIEYQDEFDPDNWIELDTFVLPSSPYLWVDPQPATIPKRFFRAVALPPAD